jgi:hypothetical protein
VAEDARVFIIDAIDAEAVQIPAVRDAYLNEYAPGARERGMVLQHDWLSPPLALKAGRSRLTFVWAVAGLDGWWGQRFAGNFDPSVEAFWRRLEPMIIGRERTFHEASSRHV